MEKQIKNQADEILKLAESYGVDQNLLFATTFERYQTQLQILDNLKETIESEGFFVDRTYVKGETNLYSHPAVTQYNRTTDSANKTAATLIKDYNMGIHMSLKIEKFYDMLHLSMNVKMH